MNFTKTVTVWRNWLLKLSKTIVNNSSVESRVLTWGSAAVIIDWDIIRYCEKLTQKQTGTNDQVEEALRKAYPSRLAKGQDTPVLDLPATLIDIHGNILFWYLPMALREQRQVFINEYLE